MKIKGLIYLMLLFVVFVSCEKSKEDDGIDPQLLLSADTLLFNGSEVKSLFLCTKPASVCKFQITSSPDWINISPKSGTISRDIQELQMSSSFPFNEPGVYEGTVSILTTFGNKSVFLRGFVGEQLIYSTPDSVYVDVFANSQNITITNDGNVPISYSASVSNDYISLNSYSGTILVGNQGLITFNVKRNDLLTGNYTSKIFFSLNGVLDTVVVSIENFKEQKLTLTSDVVDAEYSKAKDVLVYVSSTPSMINIFTPSDASTSSISLDYVPTCVSVSSDGLTAVVGHDGHITYVDVLNKSILKSFSVSCNALDIVLGNNKWAYIFPKTDQWANIRCIDVDLTNDNEVLHTGNSIYAGTKAKLHPSGKYVYGADNGLSPSDIEKYDIQSGRAVYLYDSPYHGDYPINGDLWFSEDGLRVFTRGKTVLKTTEIQDNDMRYNGSISLETTYAAIKWLDHSLVSNNLYIISSSDDYWSGKNKPYIYVYNASNLVYKSKFELEKYLVPNNGGGGVFYVPEPFYVFSTSTGDKIIALTKAIGSGLVNEWAIQILQND